MTGQIFDIVIVGAGPAGSHCARLLAKVGYQVLLVEQHSNFQENNFSSAASPIEILERFGLPKTVVASYWQKIEIVTTNVYRSWQSPTPLGVVFDFAKLREFLAEDVIDNRGKVWLGHRYIKHTQNNQTIQVYLKPKGETVKTVRTRLLIDATGFARSIIYPNKQGRPDFLKGVGIEYLIQVDEEFYQKYLNSLVFFLGYRWSPKGYSWIFPMNNFQLKVGSAWLDGEHKLIQHVKPLRDYILNIINNYIQVKNYQIIDLHGSILEYSIGLNDIYYREPNIIAIGDAVSTVNFLGGEGIRHAMTAAEIAYRHIDRYLQGESDSFQDYEKELKQYFLPSWNFSEQISRKVYLEYSDARIDRGVAYLKYLSLTDIIDILFYYKFEKYTKGLKGLLLGKLKKVIQSTSKIFKPKI